MAKIGYALLSEEHSPNDLVAHARQAEEAGFSFAMISDHFHPWLVRQKHAAFVWSTIGAISQVTERLVLGTGVTCPTVRIHPAIIAQAAATAAAMMPGRFFLGAGTGENLNEHITGQRWPAFDIRLEMLQEAIEIIRLLWEGGEKSHYGRYYTVENARLYTLPDETPKLMVAGSGSKSAKAAGRYGDGLVNTAPVSKVIDTFEEAGGKDKPRYAQVTLCWDESEEKALDVVYEHWPTSGITGELKQELPTPTHFEQAVKMVSKEDLAEKLVLGPDPERHRAGIQKFIDAGYDHVYIHQVGPNQEGFFRFYQREILPKFQ